MWPKLDTGNSAVWKKSFAFEALWMFLIRMQVFGSLMSRKKPRPGKQTNKKYHIFLQEKGKRPPKEKKIVRHTHPKKEQWRTRSWTEDLLICSQMLYHWAIHPSMNSNEKMLPSYGRWTPDTVHAVLRQVLASGRASCHSTSKGKKRESASSCVHNQRITKTECSCMMLMLHAHVGICVDVDRN